MARFTATQTDGCKSNDLLSPK